MNNNIINADEELKHLSKNSREIISNDSWTDKDFGNALVLVATWYDFTSREVNANPEFIFPNHVPPAPEKELEEVRQSILLEGQLCSFLLRYGMREWLRRRFREVGTPDNDNLKSVVKLVIQAFNNHDFCPKADFWDVRKIRTTISNGAEIDELVKSLKSNKITVTPRSSDAAKYICEAWKTRNCYERFILYPGILPGKHAVLLCLLALFPLQEEAVPEPVYHFSKDINFSEGFENAIKIAFKGKPSYVYLEDYPGVVVPLAKYSGKSVSLAANLLAKAGKTGWKEVRLSKTSVVVATGEVTGNAVTRVGNMLEKGKLVLAPITGQDIALILLYPEENLAEVEALNSQTTAFPVTTLTEASAHVFLEWDWEKLKEEITRILGKLEPTLLGKFVPSPDGLLALAERTANKTVKESHAIIKIPWFIGRNGSPVNSFDQTQNLAPEPITEKEFSLLGALTAKCLTMNGRITIPLGWTVDGALFDDTLILRDETEVDSFPGAAARWIMKNGGLFKELDQNMVAQIIRQAWLDNKLTILIPSVKNFSNKIFNMLDSLNERQGPLAVLTRCTRWAGKEFHSGQDRKWAGKFKVIEDSWEGSSTLADYLCWRLIRDRDEGPTEQGKLIKSKSIIQQKIVALNREQPRRLTEPLWDYFLYKKGEEPENKHYYIDRVLEGSPWPPTSNILIVNETGAGKSAFLLNWAVQWMKEGTDGMDKETVFPPVPVFLRGELWHDLGSEQELKVDPDTFVRMSLRGMTAYLAPGEWPGEGDINEWKDHLKGGNIPAVLLFDSINESPHFREYQLRVPEELQNVAMNWNVPLVASFRRGAHLAATRKPEEKIARNLEGDNEISWPGFTRGSLKPIQTEVGQKYVKNFRDSEYIVKSITDPKMYQDGFMVFLLTQVKKQDLPEKVSHPHQAYIFHSALTTWLRRTIDRVREIVPRPHSLENLQSEARKEDIIDPQERDELKKLLLRYKREVDELKNQGLKPEQDMQPGDWRLVLWLRQALRALAIRAYFLKEGPVVPENMVVAALEGTELYHRLDNNLNTVRRILTDVDGLVEETGAGLRFQHEALIPTLAAEGLICAWDRLNFLIEQPAKRVPEKKNMDTH